MIKRIKYFFVDIYLGIRNFIIYAPVIYKDRDFDYGYFYDLMRVKLEKMSKAGIGRRVDICLKMIPYILEENVEMNSYYKDKYTFSKNGDGFYTIDREMVEDNLEEFFKNHRAKERIVRKKLSGRDDVDNFLVAMYITMMLEDQAKRIFFRTMENNMERWWY